MARALIAKMASRSKKTRRVILPAVLRIDESENGNLIQQLAAPEWSGEAAIEAIGAGRAQGFVLTFPKDLPKVLVLTNASKPKDDELHVVRASGLVIDENEAIDLTGAAWIKHPLLGVRIQTSEEFERHAGAVRASWSNAFSYRRENAETGEAGLRPPQLGALYAVQSHWTTDTQAATVVMPTGVGKTETMLSVLVAEACKRLLVVVPTDALRLQIASKFLTLGLLKSPDFGVIAETASYPIVGILNHRPKGAAECERFLKKCNVVVTTMPLASQCMPKVMERMAKLCPNLFIDEAHHLGAPKWREFKEKFGASRIVQFTATPFRNDDKPIGGKRIFSFPLKKAQEQGYFKKINFKPVMEFDPAKKDQAIADAAVEQLRSDLVLGHILMARVRDIPRAKQVFECYKKYGEFDPVELHTGIGNTQREEAKQKLIKGDSRIVVCVDMLGEGFDLPELKIAAFHDIRKTLSVTLQLAGRFTRSKPKLGNATFVANVADLEVKDELKKLYQHDSDWNVLLPLISETAIEGEATLWDFLGGFQELPETLTLRNVKPAMSTVVYKTKCSDWTPENFEDGIPNFKTLDRFYHTLNPQERTLIIVTTRRVPVDWAQIDEIHNWDWQLYVLHWDKSLNLLFIHNSSNSGFFKRLAEAVAGEVELLHGPPIFRCLAGMNRLKLQNVGLLEQLGRLIRYTMRAGCDVEPAISETQKRKAIKSNLFGQGFENGVKSTIGCSYKGRIWSYRTTNLLELTTWCSTVGQKLIDTALDPEEVLRGTLVPELVAIRPKKMPIGIEWPEFFYKEPEQAFEFQMNGKTVYRHESELNLVEPREEGHIAFALTTVGAEAKFELRLSETEGSPDCSIKCVEGSATIKYRSHVIDLAEFFLDHPPAIWFADGSCLAGIQYVTLREQPEPFPISRIDDWNWTGTNIRVESQGITRDSHAIQHRVIRELKKKKFSVIYDDDDAGESADVVAIAENRDHIEVQFWHCKYSTEDKPGARIKELYELCGQAQKSIKWLENARDLFTHLLRRDPRRHKGTESTRYEVGTKADLFRIRQKADTQRVKLKVFVVQPGLSKKVVSRDQLELLAVTDHYLTDTYIVPFGVVTSE